ncbi:tRNA (N6-threonylcarbamoyladenosine(37)-N6)-methyltransferase TrmO [Desulfosporosinus sp.]|uniref:tRNA (N6-threonylcarbamoyladenosine(37)-N6)-methyltransferase TrmO n=1 Tax=Desulfosporosinus sp. TaxID=157907 RepID=UPI0023169A18|nr:tRNA (N6-threonylcarbamoyladenosine(37)-N6)-methyltransferase TrmO [Desulfosporosinus sp.]MDA8221066.1 tRNA (N6-threonylcarbamoyladenosine(37)-N6)-methyltransferase TrmO [Desulfitobacterium hafniense]
MSITFQSIGTIHTPYFALNAPQQPIPNAPGDFWITLDPDYASALETLHTFNYIYVLYHLNEATPPIELLTRSPWAPEIEIGLFASRSPKRPNPLGLSIVQIKEIRSNELIISGIDAYNGTPLIDIKPYMNFLDCKEDANNGWLDALPEKKHTMAHLLGLSHSHDQTSHDDQNTHDHHHAHKHTKHLHNHND